MARAPHRPQPGLRVGGWIDDLVAEGLLHTGCADVFRVGKADGDATLGTRMRLHRHQVDAIREARAGRNYVLTTGTGSGKSLAYLVPIVDAVLRTGSGGGVKAIIVYPMNALANSQAQELEKFLVAGAPGAGHRSPSSATPAKRATRPVGPSSTIRPTSSSPTT